MKAPGGRKEKVYPETQTFVFIFATNKNTILKGKQKNFISNFLAFERARNKGGPTTMQSRRCKTFLAVCPSL